MRPLQSTDVAIIGAGIVGASTALALRRRGIAVTLIDRGFCGAAASGVNYGGVRRQGRPLEQLPLAQRAHRIWSELPAHIGSDGEYVRSGHLKLARSASDLESLERYRERTRGYGLDLEILSGAALRARYPWLGPDVVGASLCPHDGHANPRLVSPAFAQAAQALGATVHEHTKIDVISRDGRDFMLHGAGGFVLRAGALVNCAGAWAGGIATQFGEPVPMTSNYPAMAVTEPVAPFLTVNIGVEGGGLYARQVARGNCVLGGTRGQRLDDDYSRPGGEAIRSLLRQAVAILPALRHVHVIRTWSGTEGYMPDRQPVIGPSATTPDLFHAFGFAGAGFQIGPAVGECIAELVETGRSSTPIEAFSIKRFQAERAGHELELQRT